MGAVVLHDGSLLLIQRATEPGAGRWSLPGGRVERGETMQEAVARETSEEAGLAVDVGDLVGWVERISADYHFVIFDFAASPAGEVDLTAGTDAADARWIALSAVRDTDVVDGLIEFLDQHQIIPALSPRS